MAGKKILFGKDARERILTGIVEAGRTVASTFGPRGRTVVYEKGADYQITKDGYTVLNQIDFTDECKKFGRKLLHEAAYYANFVNGDGSTSVSIITTELCAEINNLLNQGLEVNTIRKGLKLGRDFVLENLKSYKKEIESEEDLRRVALISANGDEEIAKYVIEAFTGIGDDGIVSIGTSQSRKGETSVVFSNGFEFDRGFTSSLSVNDDKDRCFLVNPILILSVKPFNDVEEIKPIVTYCDKGKNPLVIIAPSFDETVQAFFNERLSKKQIKGALIFSPGTDKTSIADKMRDLAVMTGGSLIGQDTELSSFDIENDIGSCGDITITKNKTIIKDPHYSENDFNEHIESLKLKIASDSVEKAYSEYEIENFKERVARMTGGIATILIGALTSVELGEKKDRYEDAVNAVRNTIKNGFILGASLPLLRISYMDTSSLTKEFGIAAVINTYLKALRKPTKILINSTGLDPEAIIPQMIKKDNMGFDARTGQVCDLFEKGIIDPYKITCNNILYATNIAEQFLSINSMIVRDTPNMEVVPLDSVLNESKITF